MDVRARGNPASQDGFALMEVIVSAAVLLLVVLGVLAALDAVAGTAAANKARTVAAALAEKDQERLRGMRTLDVDQMNLEPYDVEVANVVYRVVSEAVWVTDASDKQVGCGVSGTQAGNDGSYMRITSTVTSAMTGKAVQPVVLSSIVAPQVGAASKGSLAVLIKNAAGDPVSGIAVSAPPAAPEVTNTAGCAVFGQLEAGNYTVAINEPGYVDWNGDPAPTKAVGVIAGHLTTTEFAYDRAASITVLVQNRPTTSGGVPEPARTVLAANEKLTAKLRSISTPTAPAVTPNPAYPVDGTTTGSVFRLDNLFPFPEGYTFYSGGCLGADPSKLVPNYFSSYSGMVTLAAGETGGSVTVYEPDANFTVTSTTGTPRTGATVYAYPTAQGCTGVRIPFGTTLSTGKPAYTGLPYGDYDVCAQVWSTSASRWYFATRSVRVDTPNGASTAVSIPVPTSGTASRGTCPA